jgi:hypothetical protein
MLLSAAVAEVAEVVLVAVVLVVIEVLLWVNHLVVVQQQKPYCL